MKIGFVLFDGLTALDFVGFYDCITRLKMLGMKDVSWELCALREKVTDERGLTFEVDRIGEELGTYDLLFVPGGLGTRQLRHDEQFVRWLRTAGSVPLKASVCTGSLLLGAAGFLKGKRATTHPNAYDLLEPYCAEVVRQRIVDEGNVVTGGGVAASIDLGLYMLERLVGPHIIPDVTKSMDYPYYKSDRLL